MSRKRKVNVIDLFAGCGGLTDGFEYKNNYNILATVEWDKQCCNTLQNRLSKKWGYKNAADLVLNFDIQRIKELLTGWKNDVKYGNNVGLKKLIGKNKVDVIVGGPPCQAYSVAGRIRDKNGMHTDYRNFLFESYIALVKEFKPKFFIFENVPGILSAKPGGISIIDRIRESFGKIGYTIADDLRKIAIVDSSDFGVPQIRKRVIILGVNKNVYRNNANEIIRDFYFNILPSLKFKNKMTVKDALNDLPKFFPLNENKHNNQSHSISKKSNIYNHIPRFHSKRDIEIFKILTNDIKKRENKYTSIAELKKLYFKFTGKNSNIHKYHVLKEDEPSNTIPAHLYKDGLRHIHPDPKQARSITVREAARLQSFEDNFEFLGTMGDQYKMIGNAVPPKLAYAISEALYNLIEKY
ncbi:MAG: DNA cytosine methyltransferase [Patescibacteria group bacterium]